MLTQPHRLHYPSPPLCFAPPRGIVEPRNNARLIPDGTITSVHFVKTPLYVQISGAGDFTKVRPPCGRASDIQFDTWLTFSFVLFGFSS